MLISLVEQINCIAGIERIRLSSLEPRIINEENAKRLAALPKLCPHFHLSLQRHYTVDEFRESVRLLREVFDRPAITTDVIVGFPGETEEEFEECRKFVEDINFYEMHVFKYSPRKGTVAAGMNDQLTDKEKTGRSEVLLKMTKAQSECYRNTFVGEKLKVLWEDEEEIKGRKYMIGHTDRYVRVAVCENEVEKYGAITGEISEVSPTGFINADTLLI